MPVDKLIALDIGGTNIKAARYCNGTLTDFVKVPTQAADGFERIKSNVYSVITTIVAKSPDVRAIAVSSAGTIDCRSGRVVYATGNLPGWTGYDIKSDLEARFGLSTFAINDGHAALIGERAFGAAAGVDNCVMVTFGTGIGGAAIINGQLFTGAAFAAARLGHIILHPDGAVCTCGRRGCAEQYISASALLRRAAHSGMNCCGLNDFFADSSAVKTQILEGFLTDLEIFILTVRNCFDPELVVFGGGLVHFGDFWIDKIKARVGSVRIEAARLRNDAGMMGAAVFCKTHLKNSR